MSIEQYVIVNAKDESEDYVYETFQEARDEAQGRSEPVAVVARIFEYSDSELVWTSTGDRHWPPSKQELLEHADP